MPIFNREKKDYSLLGKEKIREIQKKVFLVSQGTPLENKSSFFSLLLCEPDGTKDQNKLLIMKFNLELNTYLHGLMVEKTSKSGSGLNSSYLYHQDSREHTIRLHHESNHKETLAAFSIDVYFEGKELGTSFNEKVLRLPLVMERGCGIKDESLPGLDGLEIKGFYSLSDHADYFLQLASMAADAKGSK